jgi:hypothetical protein
MRLLHSVLAHPSVQRVEPQDRHGEAPLERLPVDEQRRIERLFGHIDAHADLTRLAHVSSTSLPLAPE